ncbi:MAG: hypothetical protein VX346_24700 [Planctomycetota bacterium]|nr:hypothetical protein [Planctomycetota bacterium]
MRATVFRALVMFATALPLTGYFRATATGGVFNRTSARKLSLSDQLKLGLRARNSEDRAYIERVVKSVEQGKLPRRLVNAAYSYARRRRANYPLPYFRRALEILTARRC